MNRVSSLPAPAKDLEVPPTIRTLDAEDTEVGFALHLEDLFDDDISFDDFDLDLP